MIGTTNWLSEILITNGGVTFLTGLKSAWFTFGIACNGMNVLFPILNVLTFFSVVGYIAFVRFAVTGAGFTGM